jgi:hypothetical protein
VSTGMDGELLRVIGHAVLLHLDRLVGEGLNPSEVARITAHALALSARPADIENDLDHWHAHGLGLCEVLTALSGPVSATLMYWLDDALGEGTTGR